jgi:hypothetical protein
MKNGEAFVHLGGGEGATTTWLSSVPYRDSAAVAHFDHCSPPPLTRLSAPSRLPFIPHSTYPPRRTNIHYRRTDAWQLYHQMVALQRVRQLRMDTSPFRRR